MGLGIRLAPRLKTAPWKGVFISGADLADACVSDSASESVILIMDLMTRLVPLAERATSPQNVLALLRAMLTREIKTFSAAKHKKTGMHPAMRCLILTDQRDWVPARKARTHAKRARSGKRKRAFANLDPAEVPFLELQAHGLVDTRSKTKTAASLADLLFSDLLCPLLFTFLEQGLRRDSELNQLARLEFVQGDTQGVWGVERASRIGEAEVRAVFCAELLCSQNNDDDVILLVDDSDAQILALLRHRPGMRWKVRLKNDVFCVDQMWRALKTQGLHPVPWILAVMMCGTDYTFKEDVLSQDAVNDIFQLTRHFWSQEPPGLDLPRFQKLVLAITAKTKSSTAAKKRNKKIPTKPEMTAAFDDLCWLWSYWSMLQETVSPTRLGRAWGSAPKEEEEEEELVDYSSEHEDASRHFRDCFPLLPHFGF